MSEKYISQGNTYNGDGTSSAAATSNGGVGAWNDIIAVMEAAPIYGTLEGGDIVNVRTANGSGDLKVTISSTFTMLARGDWNSFITWKFDDGTIWAESGTFTFETIGNYTLTFSLNNKWLGTNKNCKFYWDYTSSYVYWFRLSRRNIFIDIEFEFGTVNGKWPYISQQQNGICYFIDCLFDMKTAAGGYNLFRTVNYNTNLIFMGCYWDCNNLSATGSTAIVSVPIIGNKYFVYGGGFLNVGATVPSLFRTTMSNAYGLVYFETHGFNFRGIDRTDDSYSTTGLAKYCNSANYFQTDETFDFDSFTDAGQVSWHKGLNFPTLNATLPDGTAWSMRCKNGDSSMCHMTRPYVDNVVQVNASAGTKKITVEYLISNLISSPTDRNFFLEIAYYDEDGEVRWESTRSNISPSALTSSTASWSTTTYDGNSFTKYKIEYELSYDIADDTLIEIVLGSDVTQTDPDEWYFICPDIIVEDA